MGCGCRGSKSTSRGNSKPDLNQFAYLTPKQLRLLEQQGKKNPNEDK